MKKISKILLLVGILILISMVVIRYRYINNKYPETLVEEYNLNEAIEYRGVELIVQDSKLMEDKDIKSMNLPSVTEFFDKDEVKAIVAKVKVRNTSNEIKEIDCGFFEAESIDWHNGLDQDMFFTLNEEGKSPELSLEPNEDVTLELPYLMFDFQYNKEEWENIKNIQYDLALDIYPVKKCVKLKLP